MKALRTRLLPHGAQDAIIAPAMVEYTKRQIAHATYSLYPGGGHSPFVEDATRFNQELAVFMDKAN